MKTKLIAITMTLFVIFSCEFRKSVNKDFITGLTTKGDGISCDNVYLSDGEKKLNRNTYTYGEKFYLNFENVEGLKKEQGSVFPGLLLFVLSQIGDTVLKYTDLYAGYTEGIKISPLLLQTYLTVADPIHSKNRYTLFASIWDKKGKGTFSAKMDFDVIADKQISIENNHLSYNEIYLYSKEREIPVTTGQVRYDENIFLIIEGLTGFREESGKVLIGQSIKITDAEGNLILNEADLVGDAEMEASGLKYKLAPSFIFSGSNIKNPVTVELITWDKKGDGRISASVRLNVE